MTQPSPPAPGTPGNRFSPSGAEISLPSAAATATANNLWTSIDMRANQAVSTWINQRVGTPRPRSMTMAVPLGQATPAQGWFTSIPIFQNVRVTAWMIQSLTAGAMSIDLMLSPVFADPATPPVLTSIINGAAAVTTGGVVQADGTTVGGVISSDPTADQTGMLSINGFQAYGFDTSYFFAPDIPGFSNLHIIVIAVSGLAQGTFGLQLTDLQGKTMQL